MLRGLTGLDRSGLGYPSPGICGGEGGGDGVEAVERKVGPGVAEKKGRAGGLLGLGTARSPACDNDREGVVVG